MQTVKKFKNSAPGPDHAPFMGIVMREVGLAKIYPYTKFEVSSFIRSKDMEHVPCKRCVREGVCPNSHVDLRRF